MQTRWARFPGAGLGLRCSVFGPRPWRDEGQGRYDLPAFFIQTEGREPKAEHRIRCPVPDTWDPIPGTGFAPRAEYRVPKTEPSYWKTRTPGMHPVSCIHILTRQ